ncbi:50S ribosomal protein L18 [Mycoplasmopsis verecunda]|uniref:Large ribosomal subunit protein uL18 n=1 Tax=Mycoplasmopsis verecunda TaxID=171291 RepID=A0A1T4KU01_9BACT|nr:50S ribosomal protein L18 [Mycoplasmopsis verecunda]WPB54651.1 50S ribosomal protein L18 [Mycoplasmopsis verecunda]SJZ45924.1 large subunit ribosomal protein L18 [Mycoplasmopsis verecunda]
MKAKSRNEARKVKHVRLRQHISGTATKPRLNIFKSHQNFYAQVIDDTKGVTLLSATTLQKGVYAGNIESAAKLGATMGQQMVKMGITEVVFDRGGYLYHGRVKAFADAVREQGVKF